MKEILLTTPNFNVCRNRFKYDNSGEIRNISYIEQWPVVIAVIEPSPGMILMVEHWRPILDVSLLECPGGKANKPGESLEEAIRREVREETGLMLGELERLCSIYSSVGASNEEITCFFARGVLQAERDPQDAKRMNLRELPKGHAFHLLKNGKISDGKSANALFHYFLRYPEL